MGISQQQALDCFTSSDLIGIGMEADAVRRRLHPEGVVTYAVDRQIDGGLSPEAIHAAIAETLDLGGTGISLRIPPAKSASLATITALFTGIKQAFPGICLQGLSAAGIHAITRHEELSVEETLGRVLDAGLDSISGRDAGLQFPDQADVWFAVHQAAHRLGMRTTANMTVGGGETNEARVQHLARLGQLQQETGGFNAFVLLTHNATGNGWDETTAVESLKTMAICRMFLDMIDNVQATGPLKVLQMGLRFGGNDVGSAVVGAKGTNVATEEELRRIIRDAGFQPVQRDTLYRVMMLT